MSSARFMDWLELLRLSTRLQLGRRAWLVPALALIWPAYRAVSLLFGWREQSFSEDDVQKFRRFAIPLWFKWAKKDPLAKEAFASQLAFMRTVNVGYVPDSMLVDVDGKTKLTL